MIENNLEHPVNNKLFRSILHGKIQNAITNRQLKKLGAKYEDIPDEHGNGVFIYRQRACKI